MDIITLNTILFFLTICILYVQNAIKEKNQSLVFPNAWSMLYNSCCVVKEEVSLSKLQYCSIRTVVRHVFWFELKPSVSEKKDGLLYQITPANLKSVKFCINHDDTLKKLGNVKNAM